MEEIIASFQYGVPAAIIVAIYLVINKILDNKRDKRQAVINADLVQSFTKLNSFLEYFTKDIIEKDQDKCQFAIKTSFNSFSNALCNFAIRTIINNNIQENKEIIIENIEHLVQTEYYNVYSSLYLYKSDTAKISDYLDENWKTELIKDITTIIFDSSKTKEQRIYNVNNKINIDINSFCVHVVNRYAKNS